MKSSSMNGPRLPVTEQPTPSQRRWRQLGEAAVGGVFGGACSLGIVHFIYTTGPETWDVAELVSLGIAFLLFVMGAITAVLTANVERYRKLVAFRQPDAEPPDAGSIATIRRQSIVIALTGPILAAPPVLAHLGLNEGGRIVGAGAMLLVLAIQSWLNWRVYRESDELIRHIALVSGALCFWALQLVLFVWAMLAKLELVADIDSWTMLTLLMATYLAVSTVVGIRRGLGQL